MHVCEMALIAGILRERVESVGALLRVHQGLLLIGVLLLLVNTATGVRSLLCFHDKSRLPVQVLIVALIPGLLLLVVFH